MPYVQCEIGDLYCLARESARSRGIQAGREIGLSPRSRLCVVDRALLATLVCVCGLASSSGVVSVGCVPWLPFYSHKGSQGFLMC